jgi:hypothetical protein
VLLLLLAIGVLLLLLSRVVLLLLAIGAAVEETMAVAVDEVATTDEVIATDVELILVAAESVTAVDELTEARTDDVGLAVEERVGKTIPAAPDVLLETLTFPLLLLLLRLEV